MKFCCLFASPIIGGEAEIRGSTKTFVMLESEVRKDSWYAYLLDELEVGDIISFRLEYLEEHRLAFDFVFSEGFTRFRGNKIMPLFIFLCEFTVLEPSKTLF